MEIIIKNCNGEKCMNNYFRSLNDEIKEYMKILSQEFPEWLTEYINTPEMLRLDGVGMSSGTSTLYDNIYNDKYFYSVLTHRNFFVS